MATTVDTLLVRIEADMADLKRDLNKIQRDVDRSTQGIAGAFKKLGPAIKAAIAAVAVREVAQFGLMMVNMASDVEEMQAKSSVVFGQFADDVRQNLGQFAQEVGRSRYELEAMASSIQDTFVPMGFARGEAAELSVQLTKLATDVASFNNEADTSVMEAFQSAIVGNHETVRRFGIIITEATLQQELYRMGIQKTVQQATEQEKIQARLNLITNGTSDAHGDAARTADSFANQTRALKAGLEALAVEIGTALLPMAKQLVEVLIAGTTATRNFLAEIGFIKLPVAEQLAKVNGEIKGLETRLTALNSQDTSNLTGIDANAVVGQRMAINSINGELAKLYEQRDLLQLQSDTMDVLNTPTAPTEEPAGPPADDISPQLRKQIEQNAVMLERIRMQRALNEATKAGDADAIKRIEIQMRSFDAVKGLTEEVQRLTDAEIARMQAEGGVANVTDLAIFNAGSYSLTLDNLKTQYSELTKNAGAYADKVNEGLEFVRNNINTNYELEQTLLAIKAAYDAGKISVEEFAFAQELLQERLREQDPVYESYKSAVMGMSQGVSNAFADMLVEGKLNMESLANVFKSFVKQMIAKALELYVFNRIMGSVFGIPMQRTSMGGYIPAAASGGSVTSGRATLVGERGPELFVPHTAGTIMNSNNTRSAMGSAATTVVQNLNFSTGIQSTVRAEVMNMMPIILEQAKGAVSDGVRRGGTYGRTFA